MLQRHTVAAPQNGPSDEKRKIIWLRRSYRRTAIMLYFRIGRERQKGHMANGRGRGGVQSVYWVSLSVILQSKRAANILCQIFSSCSPRTLYCLSPFHIARIKVRGKKRRGLSTLSSVWKLFYQHRNLSIHICQIYFSRVKQGFFGNIWSPLWS